MQKKAESSKLKAQSLKLFTVYCSLFTLMVLPACVTTENFDLLRQDVTQLQKESLSIKNELNTLKEKTSGAVREESFNAIRQSQAEIQSQLSNVSRDIQVLSGRFDENKYFMEKALKDSANEGNLIKAQMTSIEGQIKDIRERLNALESQIRQQKEPQKEQPSFQPQQQEVQPPKSAESADKTKAYEAAYNTFKEKQYKEAREKFEAFIKEFPEDELTDNAQFWIAETYYGEKDFEGAILAYEILLKKYPNSKKAPGALLKQGFSFIEIGDRKTGKVILEKLRERYPDSREAELAKKKIEEIEKKAEKRKR
ncbi:MAG: tol-pal system protein YbgF [Nitrospirota bacterium]